jgi:hypothetical protein
VITIGELAARRLSDDALDHAGVPDDPLLVVDLDSRRTDLGEALDAALRLVGRSAVLVGVTAVPLDTEIGRLVEQLDVTISSIEQADRRVVPTATEPALAAIRDAVLVSPRTAIVLCGVLRATSALSAETGLLVESFAYSALLAGPEHAAWRAGRPTNATPLAEGPSVRVERKGRRLEIILARPQRRNAYGRQMRDELVEALAVLDADDEITEVDLSGEGSAFCSGGDLDEFGSGPDPATAHIIRSVRNAAALLHRHRDLVHARVHGACIGAGAELPAFVARITAAPDAWFHLPEVSMGLIPGAGGTVSITGRIGRWRTAYLALSGARLPASTAREWGLVDELTPGV